MVIGLYAAIITALTPITPQSPISDEFQSQLLAEQGFFTGFHRRGVI
ncbi:MAG TPA: hypothetical protein VN760_04975 [Casimicrobiaceae bacterium]|nr:hypothetical protein [Casimicrobiaceae bacterium]